MIDVHVIVRTTTNPEWVEQAIASIPTGLCNVHVIDGADGIDTTTINRLKGFNSGTAEYVSFVDDDDYVLPDAFEKCYEFLENNLDYAAVGTLENKLFDDGTIKSRSIDEVLRYKKGDEHYEYFKWARLHHIIVFRREHVMPLLEVERINTARRMVEGLKFYMMEAGLKCELLPFVGYVWRIHKNNTMNNTWDN